MNESKEKYEEMYEKLMDYQSAEHERNQKKIKIGIRTLWIVPLVFLFLCFVTDSNKIIFLVLWIVSLFLIAAYLILVEYRDYTTQEAMNDISGKEGAEFEGLIDMSDAEERMAMAAMTARERIDAKVEELKL